MAGKTTVILGGGVGGIVTANTLRDQLKSEHRIILVDKQTEYDFTPSLLWVMVGKRRPERITKNLLRMVRPGVYAEPDPVVPLPRSGQIWHWGKILFEKYWFGGGLTRKMARTVLRLGSKALGITTSL